jgi:hypothetical protein
MDLKRDWVNINMQDPCGASLPSRINHKNGETRIMTGTGWTQGRAIEMRARSSSLMRSGSRKCGHPGRVSTPLLNSLREDLELKFATAKPINLTKDDVEIRKHQSCHYEGWLWASREEAFEPDGFPPPLISGLPIPPIGANMNCYGLLHNREIDSNLPHTGMLWNNMDE